MSDISSTPPSHSNQPEDVQKYQQDFAKSVELFRQAFQDYNHPDNDEAKKAKLEEVMEQALTIMNQTASTVLKEEKGRVSEERLNQDYHAFIKEPSQENHDRIMTDLEQLNEES